MMAVLSCLCFFLKGRLTWTFRLSCGLTLPETNIRPVKIEHMKRKGSSRNDNFSGAMLVSWECIYIFYRFAHGHANWDLICRVDGTYFLDLMMNVELLKLGYSSNNLTTSMLDIWRWTEEIEYKKRCLALLGQSSLLPEPFWVDRGTCKNLKCGHLIPHDQRLIKC